MLFKAKAPGTTALNITRTQVKDSFMNSIPTTPGGAQASVTIK
jgi:hypothetical protein